MKCEYINPEDMKLSAWSGGTTTEIAIFPDNAVYAERDFLWRVSTATVTLAESDFTLLPDYERLIAALDGGMRLTHGENGPGTDIVPLRTVHRFDGGADTHCVGMATDLNLMLRKGRASGSMEFVRMGEKRIISPKPRETVLIYIIPDRRAIVYRGEAESGYDRGGTVFLAECDCALFTIYNEENINNC